MKFMVVDDSDVIRTKIRNALDQDFEVVGSAANGQEAVEQFKMLRPRVITMDITMTIMDGLETIQAILDEDPDVRVLVISALADKPTSVSYTHLTLPTKA